MWEAHYKPSPQATSTREPTNPSKAPMSVLAGLGSVSEACLGTTTTNPLNIWLTDRLHLDDQGMPINALKWWIQQHCKGNTHGGLLQMALDVLSCPATTVEVERAFSFGRDYVTFTRHRLNSAPVTRGMMVAFYSKNGKIKRGVSRKWKQQQNNELKKKNKEKAQMTRIEID
ncbi:hypothetical protein PSTG_05942 [Puccinia striiformis f. sp. tritici PST-78]|uniref:HAT C-terminal dimerisation domain-containing protein n=1 Tax=Puccinia striiformis f. sp. tritici PST-78 TaxID=1165861 RepID=A0A0L0VNF0_9BASI|nr:hypothetical protein PSTG_05942 [Puccinia striiformis f. sp. tritici PST-78]